MKFEQTWGGAGQRQARTRHAQDVWNGYRSATGLTLLELLIVLTILIALGGIVVASLPGLLSRTQTAAATANVSEIDASIRRHMVMRQGQVGNRFDSLIAGSGGLSGEVASFVGGYENFQAASLSQREVAALAEIGITELIPASEPVENVTFHSHDQPPVPLSPESRVAQLVEEYAAETLYRMWNIEPRERTRYFVFGLGRRSSLVGGTATALFSEAPVHFSDDPLSNPKNMYARYLIVIEMDNSGQQRSRAHYVGTAIPDRTGIVGITDQLEEFYTNQQ